METSVCFGISYKKDNFSQNMPIKDRLQITEEIAYNQQKAHQHIQISCIMVIATTLDALV